MSIVRLAAVLAALCCIASAATAQVPGIPVVNNGAGTGISIGADLGMSNTDAGDFTAFGGSASLGIGLLGVKAMASHFSDDGDGTWATGLAGSLQIFGGPLIPLRVVLQAGVGHWEAGSATFTRVPVSLGFAATIPNPALSIKPWIAPRIDYVRAKTSLGSDSDEHFGVSGGVDFGMLSGLTFRVAYDRTFIKHSKPGILGLGVLFTP